MIKNQIIDFNKEISAGEFASKIFISFIITFTSLMILTPNLLFDTNYKSLSEIYSNSSSFDFYAFIIILFCGFIIPFVFFCNKRIYTITQSSYSFIYGVFLSIFILTPFFLIFLKDINLSSFLFTGKNGSFGLGFYSVIICYMFTLIWAIKMLLCDEKNDKLHSFCLAIIDLVVFISLFTFIKTSLWFVLFLFVCFITSIFTLILKNCSYNNTDTQDKIENN